jgi:hypothetical protein
MPTPYSQRIYSEAVRRIEARERASKPNPAPCVETLIARVEWLLRLARATRSNPDA